jgi:transposase-like protein
MEHQPETRNIQVYSDAFKRKVIEEYLVGGVSFRALMRKYKIGASSGIQRWMKKFGYACVSGPSLLVKFASLTSPDLTKKIDLKSERELLKKIKELEHQLEDEKLRSEMYARIIDKAEKELKIPIRKKPNTK